MEAQYAFLEELIEESNKPGPTPECTGNTEQAHADARTYLKE
jgi:hypothetical protein